MTAPHNFSNTASAATLAGSLSASDTAVVLDSFANFPAPPFTATIARNQPTEEIVLVTDVTGLTVTLTRGYDGTSAQAQSPGATFEHTAVAKHFRDAAAHVATTASAHGTASPVVGVNDVQTLSNKTVVALLALATAGAPALTTDAATGVTSKLLSLKQAGVEKAFVDYLGNLTAQAVTGTTATFSGALSAAALTAAASTLASLGVTGATTLTGALAANGGITVPAAKKVVLTDAPAAGTDAVNKTYADGLGTAASTASTIMRRDSAGAAAVKQITVETAPTAATHAATKAFVEGAVAGFLGSATGAALGSLTAGAVVVSVPVTIPAGLATGRRIKVSGTVHAVTGNGVGANVVVSSSAGFSESRSVNRSNLNCDLTLTSWDTTLTAGARTYSLTLAPTVGGQTVSWATPIISVEVV